MERTPATSLRSTAVRLGIYCAVAFGWSWLCWAPLVFSRKNPADDPFSGLLLLIGTFGPSVSSLLLVSRLDRTRTVRGALSVWMSWRMPLPVLAAVLVVPLLIAAVSAAWSRAPLQPMSPLMLAGYFVVYLLLGGSAAEEFGWRGYAWPRLRQQVGPAASALVLGAVWAAWHLPLFWLPGTTQFHTPFWLFVPACVGMSAWMGWATDATAGSVVPALLFHTAWNITTLLFPPAVRDGVDTVALPAAILFLVSGAIIAATGRSWHQGSH